MTRAELVYGARHSARVSENLDVLALYAWHARHHTAHITTLRQQMSG